MKTRIKVLFAAFVVFQCATASAEYTISRAPDGPFSFTISGITLNEGSSLTRESILFNDPSCPAQLTGHGTEIVYKDRGFRFSSATNLQVNGDVRAIQVRTSQFDVFGQLIQNLSNIEAIDLPIGERRITGEWRASENEITEMLTTVTYVARVRLADGSQWVFDTDSLLLALSSLDLEQKIDESE